MKRRICIASQFSSGSMRVFTIVELLISLAVIAVLASLIVPAVQQSRTGAGKYLYGGERSVPITDSGQPIAKLFG